MFVIFLLFISVFGNTCLFLWRFWPWSKAHIPWSLGMSWVCFKWNTPLTCVMCSSFPISPDFSAIWGIALSLWPSHHTTCFGLEVTSTNHIYCFAQMKVREGGPKGHAAPYTFLLYLDLYLSHDTPALYFSVWLSIFENTFSFLFLGVWAQTFILKNLHVLVLYILGFHIRVHLKTSKLVNEPSKISSNMTLYPWIISL